MNPRAGGCFENPPGSLNVGPTTSRQGGNHGPANLARQEPYRVKVPLGCNRKPGFDDVHAQAVELTRHTHLLLAVHTATWRLFPVAQGRIEYGYVLWCYLIWFRQVIPSLRARSPTSKCAETKRAIIPFGG